MKNFFRLSWAMIALVLVAQFTSCKEDDPAPEVIASFTFAVDASDFMKVQFTNASQQYATLAWEFGDGGTSAEVNPSHTYAAVGTYTVKLTATNGVVTDSHSETITIADPNAALTKLVGEGTEGKTWRLLRDDSGDVFPLECGKWDRTELWWAMSSQNDEIANRPCMLNDNFTFKRDGSLVIDRQGDYWAEGNIYLPANVCALTTDPMVGRANEDLSVWAGGNHTFTLDAANGKITATGVGAFIGFEKLGNGAEVTFGASETVPIVPPESITYDVISLYDGSTDTLIVEGQYKWDDSDGGYWRFVLVHYDDPNDEPPIPTPLPSAGFTYTLDGLTATFTNTSSGADSYSWDFGDGGTSTEENPVYTYAADGLYVVTLTATNENGTNNFSITLATSVLTDETLQGGPWKIQLTGHAIYCGEGMGADNWWPCPLAYLEGSDPDPANNWSCMMDDEFIFSAGGTYEYKTNGSSRNDGYMGTPNGCWSDAEIAASATGAPFGSCATHTWSLVPATETTRAIITLNNGPGFAAFIGFMKGYYGGENNNTANPPNGGNASNQYEVMAYGHVGDKEVLIITVDITAGHTGTGSWTVELER